MQKNIFRLLLISFLVIISLLSFLFYWKYSAAKNTAPSLVSSQTNASAVPETASSAPENKPDAAPDTEIMPETLTKEIMTDSSEEKPSPSETLPEADCPGDILNLVNWKQTLPTGKAEKPAEIKQPELAKYTADPYFRLNTTRDGVVCRAPVNGVTTSGSGYPRSELREMTANGKDLASWSTTAGTHTMFIDEAITAVPKNKKHVVAGQIHDADDDVIVIRLEYPKLFVDINGETGPTLDANYTLGKRFTVKFVASGGKINVYYNGNQTPTCTLQKKTTGCYFKAGAYTQSNCSKESDCSSSNYGEVVIYDLSVSH